MVLFMRLHHSCTKTTPQRWQQEARKEECIKPRSIVLLYHDVWALEKERDICWLCKAACPSAKDAAPSAATGNLTYKLTLYILSSDPSIPWAA